MPSQLLLSIDFGTSGIKCMIFTSQGEIVAKGFRPIVFHDAEGLAGIGKEFDASEAWRKITQLIRTCLKELKTPPREVIGIASTSQRLGAVFLDEDGKVIYAGPNLDARGVFVQDSIMQELETSCPPTGCWPPLLYPLSRLLWFKKHKPEQYRQIRHILSINDWIIFQLTGKVTTDPTQASNTQFLDIQKSKWSPEILEMADISNDLLPSIMEPGSPVSTISAQASKLTGLHSETLVAISGGDTQCGLLGSKVAKSGEVSIITGNTSPIQLITKEPILDPEARLWTGRFLLPNRWVLEANTGKTGAVLKWFVENIVYQIQPSNLHTPEAAYRQAEDLASQANLGSLDTFALLGPTIMDAKNLTTVYPALFLFPPPTSPVVTPITIRELTRSVFENISYAVRANLELLQEVAGISFNYCTVAGGLSQSQFWVQMLADVTGLQIQSSQVFEASSLGAAICAAVATNLYDSLLDGMENMVKSETTIQPQETMTQKYETYFTRWKTLYKQSAKL